jgi:hypothetical protein
MSQEMVADRNRLSSLQVCVPGHDPIGVRFRLVGEGIHESPYFPDGLGCGISAVKPKVESDLVVTRTTCMQRGTRRCDLGQPALNRGMYVLVAGPDLEFV